MAQAIREIQRRESRAMYSARKLGIIIDLSANEQEQTDTM